MTGFGNPRFEGLSGSGQGMTVTSPKALLASISSKAGFAPSARQAPFIKEQV
jgi:hypothetical protein